MDRCNITVTVPETFVAHTLTSIHNPTAIGAALCLRADWKLTSMNAISACLWMRHSVRQIVSDMDRSLANFGHMEK